MTTPTETQSETQDAAPMEAIDWLRAMMAWVPQYEDHLQEAVEYIDEQSALLTRQQEEIDQRNLLLGEAKSILSLLVSDTTSTSSQSIWAQCVSLECRIRAALQAKP